MILNSRGFVFWGFKESSLCFLILLVRREKREREKETNYGVKDGADFFFVEREREREGMERLCSVLEESMGGKRGT